MQKKHALSFILALLIPTTSLFSQQRDPRYFNEVPPGKTPKVFASQLISTESDFEFGAVFSRDLKEFFYAVEINGKAEIRHLKSVDDMEIILPILIDDQYSFNDPFLSPDNKRLFFISDRPLSGTGPKKDYDIWYIERQSNGWSEPKNAGKNINTARNEYYISFTKTGKMYFSSNGKNEQDNYDIYTAEWKGGQFQSAVPVSAMINTSSYEADVFVAPDESYVVFAANRPGGLGSGDLYVSFRKQDGTWTLSKSLGNSINTETDDFCPYVSPDGKYLFYASRGDIYWVSTDVIKVMR